MTVKCADFVAQYLKDRGIRHVFGIIGAGNAHLFDAIGRLGFTEIICVHHEQAAVMAVGTYYRTKNVITAALVTTGAGSSNAFTGVVSLWMDSIPGVIISGNEKSTHTRASNPLRVWGVQGYDSSECVKPVSKYASRVLDVGDIELELEKAFQIAGDGKPGPTWIDIPMDIQASQLDPSKLKKYIPIKADSSGNEAAVRRGDVLAPVISEEKLQTAVSTVASLLKNAKRPVIWLGHGIRMSGAVDLIEPLIQQTKSPSLVTWQGIDMIDSNHPLVYGRAGVYGQRAANFVLQNCDFLLTIGTRLAIPQIGYDLSELCREAKIAVVDIDETESEKLGDRAEITVAVDAKRFIESLLKAVTGQNFDSHADWIKQCNDFRERYPFIGPEHADSKGYINSYKFMDRLNGDLNSDRQKNTIVVTDMGTALLSGHQVLRMKGNQRLMTSTGLGEMGFGLPAAIGASFGSDHKEVICLNCDGGMMMNLQEMQTIKHHDLPVKIVVFNNDGYLMIKHTQKNLFSGKYVASDKKSGVTCPDYTKVATAFEIPAFQIRTWADYDDVMKRFLSTKGPALCEVFTDPEQYFYPKLGVAIQKDGTLVSPPLEDLSPFISRDEMRKNMIVGIHPKSAKIDS